MALRSPVYCLTDARARSQKAGFESETASSESQSGSRRWDTPTPSSSPAPSDCHSYSKSLSFNLKLKPAKTRDSPRSAKKRRSKERSAYASYGKRTPRPSPGISPRSEGRGGPVFSKAGIGRILPQTGGPSKPLSPGRKPRQEAGQPTTPGSSPGPGAVQGQHVTKHRDGHQDRYREGTPLQRFRRVARLVRMLCSVCMTIQTYAIGKGILDNYLVAVSHKSLQKTSAQEEEAIEELTFNLKDFKVRKELLVPAATIRRLEKRPDERSAVDIATINHLLRGLPSFRKYTRDMQQLLCKIVRYMRCNENRVVLRKGHIGYTLYFIYSGACSVVLDEDKSNIFSKKELVVLRKGACFGEVALVENTRRNATIVCKEDTEFLVVDKDLFEKNGLKVQMQEEFQQRYRVFRSWPLLADWTDQRIRDLSYVSRIEEFHYNRIVVKDSTKNEWLWFIVKGSCDIFRLVDLKMYPTHRDMILASSNTEKVLFRGSRSVKDKIQTENPRHRTKRSETNIDMKLRPHSASSLVEKDEAETDKKEEEYTAFEMLRKGEVDELFETLDENREEDTSVSLPPVTEETHTHVDDFLADISQGLFFKVDALRDGQCFGVNTLHEAKSSDRPFVLVSRGCEVIHVPKTRFLELSDKATMTKLLKRQREYPGDEDLCRKFLARVQWEGYKQAVVNEVIQSHENKETFEESLRKQNPIASKSGRGKVRASPSFVFTNATQHCPRRARPHTAFIRRPKSCRTSGRPSESGRLTGRKDSVPSGKDYQGPSTNKSWAAARPGTCPPGLKPNRLS